MTVEYLDRDGFIARYVQDADTTPEVLSDILTKQASLYQPEGWVMFQCQDLCSSYMGRLCIAPFGPNNTYKEIPDHPVSPRGLSSDTSVVIAVLLAESKVTSG